MEERKWGCLISFIIQKNQREIEERDEFEQKLNNRLLCSRDLREGGKKGWAYFC